MFSYFMIKTLQRKICWLIFFVAKPNLDNSFLKGKLIFFVLFFCISWTKRPIDLFFQKHQYFLLSLDLPNVSILLPVLDVIKTKAMEHVYNEAGQTFWNWGALEKDNLTFIAATEISIFPQFLTRYVGGQDLGSSMLKVKFSIWNTGKTSASIATEICHAATGAPLISDVIKFIHIDRETRKPKPLPLWFLQKYQGKGTHEKDVFAVERFERPESTFVHCVRVLFQDTDSNNHTSYSIYVNFAINALHYGLLVRADKNCDVRKRCEYQRSNWCGDVSALDGMSEEIVRNGVKKARVCFISESKLDDKLDVHVWKSDSQLLQVKVSIETPSGDKVCQVTLEFYERKSKL